MTVSSSNYKLIIFTVDIFLVLRNFIPPTFATSVRTKSETYVQLGLNLNSL